MADHLIKYRTFDQLLESVADDLPTQETEGMIEPSQLVKVVTKINSELGLKIHKTKEVVLEVDNRKARLPLDFYVLNFGLMCTSKTVSFQKPSGTHVEDVIIDIECECETPSCGHNVARLNPCGGYYKLQQHFRTETRTYETFDVVKLANSKKVDCTHKCPNLNSKSPNEIEIVDGFVKTNFDKGTIYLNYEGNLENEDGELMVLDHPMVNDYYEKALIARIFRNIKYSGDDRVYNHWKDSVFEEKAARTMALSYVYFPDFEDLRAIHDANRRHMYNKYYSIFR